MVMGTQSNKSNVDEESHQAVLHDFFGGVGGRSCDSDPPVKLALPSNMDVAKPATSGDSAGGKVVSRLPEAFPPSYGGTRGPFSSPSERRLGSQYDQFTSYTAAEHSVPEASNRFVGSKRSSSDTGFVGMSKEGLIMPRSVPESIESSHPKKYHTLWSRNDGERHISVQYDKTSQGIHQMRPGPVSLSLHTSGTATVANLSKRGKSILVNVEGVHHVPCVTQVSPFVDQIPSNRLRDGSTGPAILSQQAADEGSRTGIKGSGILSAAIATRAISEKNLAASVLNSSDVKLSTNNSELDSSNPPVRHQLSSFTRQMTIIYRGQVHIFDDVHPYKADVIMALAGTSKETCLTTLPKSSAKSTVNDE